MNICLKNREWVKERKKNEEPQRNMGYHQVTGGPEREERKAEENNRRNKTLMKIITHLRSSANSK